MTPLRRFAAPGRKRRPVSGAGGFSLLEALVAVAVLGVALLPALAAMRHLLSASADVLRSARSQCLIEHVLAGARAELRQGRDPAAVSSGTAGARDPLRWVLRVEEAGNPGSEVRRLVLRCRVETPDGPVEAEVSERWLFLEARSGTKEAP